MGCLRMRRWKSEANMRDAEGKGGIESFDGVTTGAGTRPCFNSKGESTLMTLWSFLCKKHQGEGRGMTKQRNFRGHMS